MANAHTNGWKTPLSSGIGAGLGAACAVTALLTLAFGDLERLSGPNFEAASYLKSAFFFGLAAGPPIGCYVALKLMRRKHAGITALGLVLLLPLSWTLGFQVITVLSNTGALRFPEELPVIGSHTFTRVAWASTLSFLIASLAGLVAGSISQYFGRQPGPTA